MIEVQTVRNNTRADGDKYCFSSVADTVIEKKELIARMRQYNSTLTEADANAALEVLDESVRDLLEKGCKVKLPWVTLYLTARGTAENEASAFRPGKGDNRFVLKAAPNRKAEKEIAENVFFRSKSGGIVLRPLISSISYIQQDASESYELIVKKGRNVRIRGRNLKFDKEDQKQGVFLLEIKENEGRKLETGRRTKLSVFSRLTERTIDASIPESLENGEYKIEVVTKEKTSGYLSERSRNDITVE